MKLKVENGTLVWKKFFQEQRLSLADVEWAYLQQESVTMKLCCGRGEAIIGRLIVVKKDGEKEVFQYEGLEKPKALLEQIHQANDQIAIGYTSENKARFGIVDDGAAGQSASRKG
ncbi:MAG: hypothetical protein ACI4C1_06255 [Lachnospiraceae bacterium]